MDREVIAVVSLLGGYKKGLSPETLRGLVCDVLDVRDNMARFWIGQAIESGKIINQKGWLIIKE